MKAGKGMQDIVQYMDLDTGLREGVARGASGWTLLFVVIFVFTALIIVLRVAVKRVADQKTRRIILESMEDDAPLSPPKHRDSQGSPPDSGPDPR
jgi:hypothetical protein